MSEIKNIIYVTYQSFPANTANSLQTISNIKYFIKNGVDVNLVFPLREKKSSADLNIINKHYGESLKFKVTGSQHNYLFGSISNSSRFLYLISHFLWSRKIVKNEYKDIDKSTVFFTRSDWVFFFLSKKKFPVIFECHQYTKIRKLLIYLSLKNKKSKVIFLNKNLKIDYEKKYSLNDNYSILQNGVDTELFLENYNKNKQLIFVGKLTRFGKSRNLDFIINSFSKLDSSYKLKIIGAKKGEEDSFSDLLKDETIKERIEILPYINHREVIKHILESEIGILVNSEDNIHSTRYTSPLKYFEYLLGGVKVVATDNEAHKKLIYSENISFFNLKNEQSFIDAINNTKNKKLLTDEEKQLISLELRAKEIISMYV
tara:strand:- start:15 stop:1133 length:1119 start_codon:yes stop_codon:yes gene_type:complete